MGQGRHAELLGDDGQSEYDEERMAITRRVATTRKEPLIASMILLIFLNITHSYHYSSLSFTTANNLQ